MKTSLLTSFAFPLVAFAHFGINYPEWRADSLAETNESISQWMYPCANVQPMQNSSLQRTPWPLDGGSLSLELHHHWTYLFVNLGFGSAVTNFNVSLNPDGGRLLNETGNGTFCWNRLPVPSAESLGLEITEGTEASIQVVTVGDSGAALYNCADIVFTANATLLPAEECFNSTGVTAQSLEGSAQATNTSDGAHDSNATSSTGSGTASTGKSAASSQFVVSSFALSASIVVLVAGLVAL